MRDAIKDEAHVSTLLGGKKFSSFYALLTDEMVWKFYSNDENFQRLHVA